MAESRRSTRRRLTASFSDLKPASSKASKAASASSRKRGTRCELVLEQALVQLGLSFQLHVSALPGCPDFVFDEAHLVVFADGDFWHGRRLNERLARLKAGHNSDYWIRKIQSNVARDRRTAQRLRRAGWSVMRVWEGDINRDARAVAQRIARKLQQFHPP